MARRNSAIAGTLSVGGVEYVVIPKADYLLMQTATVPEGSVDAHAFVRQSLCRTLRAAREHASLTQADLADRMGKSQTMVSQAESGDARVSERYVLAVLEACGLPANWVGPKAKASKRRAKK